MFRASVVARLALAVLLAAPVAGSQIATFFGNPAGPAPGFGPGYAGWAIQLNTQPPIGDPDVLVLDGMGATVYSDTFPNEDTVRAFLAKAGNTGTGDPPVLAVITGHDNGVFPSKTYTWTLRLINLVSQSEFKVLSYTERGLRYHAYFGMGGNALYVDWSSTWSTGTSPVAAKHWVDVISLDYGTGTGVPMPASLSTPGAVWSMSNASGVQMYQRRLFVLAGPFGDLLALRCRFSSNLLLSDPTTHLIVADLRTPATPTVVFKGLTAQCRSTNFGLMADDTTFVVVGVRDLPCGNGVSDQLAPGVIGPPVGTAGFTAVQWPGYSTRLDTPGLFAGFGTWPGMLFTGQDAVAALGINTVTWMAPSAYDVPNPLVFSNKFWAPLPFAWP